MLQKTADAMREDGKRIKASPFREKTGHKRRHFFDTRYLAACLAINRRRQTAVFASTLYTSPKLVPKIHSSSLFLLHQFITYTLLSSEQTDPAQVSSTRTETCSDIDPEKFDSVDCTARGMGRHSSSKIPIVSKPVVDKNEDTQNVITGLVAQMVDSIDLHSSTGNERQILDTFHPKVPLANASVDLPSFEAQQPQVQSRQTSLEQGIVTTHPSAAPREVSTSSELVLRNQPKLPSDNGRSHSILPQRSKVDTEANPTLKLATATQRMVTPAKLVSRQPSPNCFAREKQDICDISDIEAELQLDDTIDHESSHDENPVTEASIRQRFTALQDESGRNQVPPTYPHNLQPPRPLCHVNTQNDPCLLIHRWPRIPTETTSHRNSGPAQMKAIFDAFHKESAENLMKEEVNNQTSRSPAKAGNNGSNTTNDSKERLALLSGVLIDRKHSAHVLHGTEKPPLTSVGSGGYYGTQRSAIISGNAESPKDVLNVTSGEKRNTDTSQADPPSSEAKPQQQRKILTAKRTLPKGTREVEKTALKCVRSRSQGQNIQGPNSSRFCSAPGPSKNTLQGVKNAALESSETTKAVLRSSLQIAKIGKEGNRPFSNMKDSSQNVEKEISRLGSTHNVLGHGSGQMAHKGIRPHPCIPVPQRCWSQNVNKNSPATPKAEKEIPSSTIPARQESRVKCLPSSVACKSQYAKKCVMKNALGVTPQRNLRCSSGQTKQIPVPQSQSRPPKTTATQAGNVRTLQTQQTPATPGSSEQTPIMSSAAPEAQAQSVTQGLQTVASQGNRVVYHYPTGLVPIPTANQAQIGTSMTMTASGLQSNQSANSAHEIQSPLPAPLAQLPMSPIIVGYAPVTQTVSGQLIAAPIYMLPYQANQVPGPFIMNFGIQAGQIGQAAAEHIASDQAISGHLVTGQTPQFISPTSIPSPQTGVADQRVTSHPKASLEGSCDAAPAGTKTSSVGRAAGQNEPNQNGNASFEPTSATLAPKANEKQTETKTRRKYTKRASPSSSAPKSVRRSYKQRRTSPSSQKNTAPMTPVPTQTEGSKAVTNASLPQVQTNGVAQSSGGKHMSTPAVSKSAPNKWTKQQLKNSQCQSLTQRRVDKVRDISTGSIGVDIRPGHVKDDTRIQGRSAQEYLMQVARSFQKGPAPIARTQATVPRTQEILPLSSEIQDPSAKEKGKVRPATSSKSHVPCRKKQRTMSATKSPSAGAEAREKKSLPAIGTSGRKEESSQLDSTTQMQIAPVTPANLETCLFSPNKEHEISPDRAGASLLPDQNIDCPLDFLEDDLPELSEIFNGDIDDI